MALGVLLSIISFVVVYAKLSALSSSHLLLRSSTVVRSYEERRALLCKANRGKIVTISLKGYVFFGSAVKILEEVKGRVILTPSATSGSPTFTCTEGRVGSDELSESNGDISTPIQCQAPMFSFQMNRGGASEKKKNSIAQNASAKERQQTKSIMNERDLYSQQSAYEMAYMPMPSSSSSDSVHRKSASSESEYKSNGSKASYAPLQNMSTKSKWDDRSQCHNAISFLASKEFSDNEEEGDGEEEEDDEDDDDVGDKEKGSEVDDGHTETSGNSNESKNRRSVRKGRGAGSSTGLPPKSKAIPLHKSTSSSLHGMGQGVSDPQRDTANHLIAGSPLQSLSAYNLDQDQLSSYQKRWIHDRDRDRDRDRDLVGSISRSGSAQSLPHSAQKSPSPSPYLGTLVSTLMQSPALPFGQFEARGVRSLEDVEDARGNEQGSRKSRPDSFKDLVSTSPLRDRTQPASSPLSIASKSNSNANSSHKKGSNLSSNLARSAVTGKESPSGQGQGHVPYHVQVQVQVQVQVGEQPPVPVCRPATRTQSMSQLISSASSINPNSILSAVWSSQERRRERAKLLSAGDRSKSGDGERRSRSYNSLSAACIPIIAETSTLRDIYAPLSAGLEMEDSRRIDLTARPRLLDTPPHTHPNNRGAASGQNDGAGANADLEPTEYLILDFTEVLGIDATSARSCFLMLVSACLIVRTLQTPPVLNLYSTHVLSMTWPLSSACSLPMRMHVQVQLMRSSGVKVVFAAMSPGIESLLAAHGVIRRSAEQSVSGGDAYRDFEDADIVISTADEALGEERVWRLRDTDTLKR